jgi:hypothetical protein
MLMWLRVFCFVFEASAVQLQSNFQGQLVCSCPRKNQSNKLTQLQHIKSWSVRITWTVENYDSSVYSKTSHSYSVWYFCLFLLQTFSLIWSSLWPLYIRFLHEAYADIHEYRSNLSSFRRWNCIFLRLRWLLPGRRLLLAVFVWNNLCCGCVSARPVLPIARRWPVGGNVGAWPSNHFFFAPL